MAKINKLRKYFSVYEKLLIFYFDLNYIALQACFVRQYLTGQRHSFHKVDCKFIYFMICAFFFFNFISSLHKSSRYFKSCSLSLEFLDHSEIIPCGRLESIKGTRITLPSFPMYSQLESLYLPSFTEFFPFFIAVEVVYSVTHFHPWHTPVSTRTLRYRQRFFY